MTERTTVAVRTSDGRAALLPPFTLTVTAGPQAGSSFSSSAERVVIGTHERAELLLTDRTVSRFHCEISVKGDRIAVKDLGSRNGTIVDGVPIAEAFLRDGHVIALGETRIRFALADGSVRVPIADRFGSLIGSSLPMQLIFATLERVAKTDVTVLLEGETGTGKELAAESIHAAGMRASKPFIVVDCGAIPESLLESELFGHEKGAFTGAVTTQEGAFQAANGGTLFLDEIGELGADLQPKLLRALESREVRRVGSPKHVSVDVRVIAATNRSLRAEVNAGRFRSDLYYRLAVLEVRLPPLRERVEDIPLLVERILEDLGAKDRPEAAALRTDTCRADLARHPWPGNVRELRNYVERSLVLAEPQELSKDAPPSEDDYRTAKETWTRSFEKTYLQDLLSRHGDNVTAAAKAAGVDRKYLYRMLWRHGLR